MWNGKKQYKYQITLPSEQLVVQLITSYNLSDMNRTNYYNFTKLEEKSFRGKKKGKEKIRKGETFLFLQSNHQKAKTEERNYSTHLCEMTQIHLDAKYSQPRRKKPNSDEVDQLSILEGPSQSRRILANLHILVAGQSHAKLESSFFSRIQGHLFAIRADQVEH